MIECVRLDVWVTANGLSTWFLSGPCSLSQNCERSLCRSLDGAAAGSPWDTGAWMSWAELLCGTEEAGCYWSHCGSHYPDHLRRCPDRPKLQQDA